MPLIPNSNEPQKKDENPTAVLSPKEQLSVDVPVGYKQHAEGDLHLIDESLPAPDSVSTLDTSKVIGQSPYPARADHKHSFADGTVTVPAFGWGNMGFYKAGATVVGLSINGAGRFSWDNNRFYAPSSMSIGSWAVNGSYGAIEGSHGYLILGSSIGDTATYLRSSGQLNLGSNGYVDRITITNTGVSITPTLNCNAISSQGINSNGYNITAGSGSVLGGYFQADAGMIINGAGNSSVHSNQLLQIRSSGTVSGLSMWPTNWGIAPVLRCFNGNGESIDCGNNPGTGYAVFGALSFTTWSTERLKKEIVRARKSNSSALKLLESATWDDISPDAEIWPTARFTEINDKWVAKGKKPLTVTEKHTEQGFHDCSVNSECCGNGVDIFCGLHKRHHSRRGFVAEDVFEVFPQAVAQDNQNNINGIDYNVIVVEMWDIICELNERVESLEERLAAK